MSAPAKVVVRMYRNLLGDCFLIRLWDDKETVSHILIDCGLLQGVAGAKDTLTKIAEDIEQTTGGDIDLLVITHEHWDHMGGFSLAKDILLDPDRIRYRNVWMAWTEDPKDDQANELRQRLTDRKTAMADVAVALDGTEKLDDLTLDLFKFIGPVETLSAGFGMAPQGRLTGSRVMEEIKKAAEAQPPQYLEPGTVLDTPGAASLPAAVLGPPRSIARLKQDLPQAGAGKETYFAEEFLAYSLGVDGTSGNAGEMRSPFTKHYCVPAPADGGTATAPAWANALEGTTERWIYDHYFAPNDDSGRPQYYRRIDSDWSLSASSLALKLDSDTNNTSLVLALMLPDDTFLLFAADAQVGNWLSWHEQPYRFGDDNLTAADILGRTRLYKVGHHGSHNATLRAKGLELMTHPDLSCMVSTIEDVAKQQGTKGWQMPDPDVKGALLEHCHGRMIRGDRYWASDQDTASYRDQPIFTEALDERSPLYVELTVYRSNRSAKKGKANGRHVQSRQRTAVGRAHRSSAGDSTRRR